MTSQEPLSINKKKTEKRLQLYFIFIFDITTSIIINLNNRLCLSNISISDLFSSFFEGVEGEGGRKLKIQL